MSDDQPRRGLDQIPAQTEDPIVWDPAQRRFVPSSERLDGAPAPPPDPRRFFVGADAVGRDLPPQPGTPPPVSAARSAPPVDATAAAAAPAPVAPASATATIAAAPPAPPAVKPPLPLATPTPPGAPPPTTGKPKRRKRFRWVPRLRWIILVATLLPVLLIAAGLYLANQKFHELHRVPVGAALDSGGSGDNILIVGSDSRDVQVASDATGITGDASNPAPTGQRSDTMMILRLDSKGARIMSVPRDLIVTIADTNERNRVNASYNTDLGGGPLRLIKTIKQNLGIPINRYIEVDFATFAGVVDSLGGITINFPYPAYDDNTGLNIPQAGDVKLNGEQALEYVRSRHYVEIKNGKKVEDPTADLGRIARQQQFLTTVLGKIGKSHNPLTLLKVGGEVVKGLRVDDKLGFFDALRLGWDLKGLHPETVELPTKLNNDHATLALKEPDADATLASFK